MSGFKNKHEKIFQLMFIVKIYIYFHIQSCRLFHKFWHWTKWFNIWNRHIKLHESKTLLFYYFIAWRKGNFAKIKVHAEYTALFSSSDIKFVLFISRKNTVKCHYAKSQWNSLAEWHW